MSRKRVIPEAIYKQAERKALAEHDRLWYGCAPVEEIPTFKELLARFLPPTAGYSVRGNVIYLTGADRAPFPKKGPGRLPKSVIRLADYRSSWVQPETSDRDARLSAFIDTIFESMCRRAPPPGAA